MDKLLLRPDQAAEVLGIGRSKVYALLADGTLPSVRVGKSVRVPAAELQSWVREHASRRTAAPQVAEAEQRGQR